jgi:ABC-type uncharacterized transport system involved in gliding motility auxiliary subunit
MENSAPKRILVGMNVIIQIIAAIVICVVANVAIQRWHPRPADLNHNDYYKLSDKTKQLLGSLKSDVEIILFFQPDSEWAYVVRIKDDLEILLKEYQSESKHVKVTFVDPNRDLAKAEKYLQDYKVTEANVTIVVHGNKNKTIRAADMVDFDRSNASPFGGGSDRIKTFKGEQQLTSAIQNVLEEKQSKIYFLSGHGEGDPDEADPRTGYSVISSYMKKDNLLVEKLNFFTKQEIPKDCEVLIVCGPQQAFTDSELKAIRDYLSRDGRLMVLLDALKDDAGLIALLSEYGVKVGNDAVLVTTKYMGGQGVALFAPGYIYGEHPITDSLRKAEVSTILPAARTIDKSPTKEKVTVLVQTPELAWAETDLVNLRQDKATLDSKDRKGPVPLGVAVEPDAAGSMERQGMRIVVFGSSSFVKNQNLRGGNMDLFMNSVNWLIKRQQLLGIAPKTPQEFSLSLDVFQRRGILLTEVVGIPFAIGVVGVAVWLRRRK